MLDLTLLPVGFGEEDLRRHSLMWGYLTHALNWIIGPLCKPPVDTMNKRKVDTMTNTNVKLNMVPSHPWFCQEWVAWGGLQLSSIKDSPLSSQRSGMRTTTKSWVGYAVAWALPFLGPRSCVLEMLTLRETGQFWTTQLTCSSLRLRFLFFFLVLLWFVFCFVCLFVILCVCVFVFVCCLCCKIQ